MTGSKAKIQANKSVPDYALPHHYFANNQIITALINSILILAPEGEKFITRSINRFRKDSDTGVKYFTNQEAKIKAQHSLLTKTLTYQGFDPEYFSEWYKKAAFTKGFEPAIRQAISYIFNEEKSNVFTLATAAGLERSTVSLAQIIIANKELILRSLPEDMANMLLASAYEKTEITIAQNILQEQNQEQIVEVVGQVIAVFSLAVFVSAGFFYFFSRDKEFKLSKLPSDLLGILKIIF